LVERERGKKKNSPWPSRLGKGVGIPNYAAPLLDYRNPERLVPHRNNDAQARKDKH